MVSRIGPYHLQRYVRHGTMPQLAAFYAVATMGSVTRAAESLCIAQPTLSGHLRKLSEALGVSLFVTVGKRLEPTEAARALLVTAEQVFAAFEQCELRLAEIRAASSASGSTSARAPTALLRTRSALHEDA